MTTLAESAIKYAKLGFYVLPMIGKKPFITFADQPALTIDEIKKYWSLHENLNIALRTVQFFVVDIDRNHTEGIDGMQSINQLRKKYPHVFLKTFAQQTAHGGLQLFYKKPKDIEIQQQIGWLKGVDIKAHINNYVLIFPSVVDGKQYINCNQEPINKPSKKLIELLTANKKEIQKPSNFKFKKGIKTSTTLLFEQLVHGLGDKGGRNDALTSFIGGLLYRNVDTEDVLKLANMINANTPDPLSDKEVFTTFNSMVKKEIRRVGRE